MNQKPQSFTVLGKIISFNPPVIKPVMVITLEELRKYGKYWLRAKINQQIWDEAEPNNIFPSTESYSDYAI